MKFKMIHENYNVSDLARIGMRETNEEIIRLMIKTV